MTHYGMNYGVGIRDLRVKPVSTPALLDELLVRNEAAVRGYRETLERFGKGSTQADLMKQGLIYVTPHVAANGFSPCVRGNKNVCQRSRLLMLDFDNIDGREVWEKIKALLLETTEGDLSLCGLAWVYVTVSGGLRVVAQSKHEVVDLKREIHGSYDFFCRVLGIPEYNCDIHVTAAAQASFISTKADEIYRRDDLLFGPEFGKEGGASC